MSTPVKTRGEKVIDTQIRSGGPNVPKADTDEEEEEAEGSASQDGRDKRNFLYPHGDPVQAPTARARKARTVLRWSSVEKPMDPNVKGCAVSGTSRLSASGGAGPGPGHLVDRLSDGV
jgi:hypothetical protein